MIHQCRSHENGDCYEKVKTALRYSSARAAAAAVFPARYGDRYRGRGCKRVGLRIRLCASASASASGSADSPENFTVAAKAALLIDLNSGRTLYEQNADEKVYPASLTKIMTCLLALENGNLSDVVTVSESALSNLDPSSSTANLKAGEQMTLENILYCMMVVSANEACDVVAEHIAGSIPAFVEMMNARAAELGCTGTHFANPHGLHDENHYTTAHDLALITEAALKSETFKQITSTVKYTVPATNMSDARELETTNKLLIDSNNNPYYYPKATGIKTGYTSYAGRCVISTAKDGDMYLLGIVCGADTVTLDSGVTEMESFPECIRLFNYGFDNYSYVTVLSTLYPVAQVSVANSAGSEAVAVAPAEDVRLLLPNGYDQDQLKTEIQLTQDTVEAPVSAGTVLGTDTVTYNGEIVGKTNLTAIADVARSEISAAASDTSTYIQRNWWKWVVLVIVLLVVAFIVFLVMLEMRRKKRRRQRLEQRRRALQEHSRDSGEDS
jgi:D-alanyl-D-alanine carboxypeptidase (penicillin-binding protein 5/6)